MNYCKLNPMMTQIQYNLEFQLTVSILLNVPRALYFTEGARGRGDKRQKYVLADLSYKFIEKDGCISTLTFSYSFCLPSK